ncbi:MAG: DUF4038 domain-containing protein [Thiogranum sp.]|nr:DUF4038 domain-containing protein [Thiogranum sp.]
MLFIIVLTLLAGVAQSADQPRSAAVERISAAVESVRFVAYTPTDLRIVAGEVLPASAQQIRKDLSILRKDFQGLVMYSGNNGLEEVPAIARELGFEALILGIWDIASEDEIANVIRLARAYPGLIVGVSVGNEVLLAERHEWAALREAIQRLRAALPQVAITTSEPFYFYLNEDPPDFLSVQDFLLPSVHPLFETWFPEATTEIAVDFVVQVAERLTAKTDKPVLIKETGLPSGPPERGFTPARQSEFWVELSQRLPPAAGLVYFEAFDHAWKVENAEAEFGVRPEEAFWGLYEENGEPKPALKALRRVWNAPPPAPSGKPWDLGELRVSANGRYLEHFDGAVSTPFFWLGDTAWLMPHRLTLSEADSYLADRKRKGFTLVQIMVTGSGSIEGLLEPSQSRGIPGELPFHGEDGSRPQFNDIPEKGARNNLPDPTRPNEVFFQHIDDILDKAGEYGLYVVLSPTWGRYVCPRWYEPDYTPVVFDAENAVVYGRFLGERYKDRPNIIWLLGGDRTYCDYGVRVWNGLATGIRRSGDRHLMSYHPSRGDDGYTSSGYWLYANNDQRYPSWLDFNTSQPDSHLILYVNTRDYQLPDIKPTVVGETDYFDPGNEDDLYGLGVFRSQPYWTILSGAAGYTYGNDHVWWFDKDDASFPERRSAFNVKDGKIWSDEEYLNSEGTQELMIWKDYFSSIDWWNLVPDQSVILKGANRFSKFDYKVAARSRSGDRLLVYYPAAASAKIDVSGIAGGSAVRARWLNTRDGSVQHDSTIPAKSAAKVYRLPSGWEDGLLILERVNSFSSTAAPEPAAATARRLSGS